MAAILRYGSAAWTDALAAMRRALHEERDLVVKDSTIEVGASIHDDGNMT